MLEESSWETEERGWQAARGGLCERRERREGEWEKKQQFSSGFRTVRSHLVTVFFFPTPSGFCCWGTTQRYQEGAELTAQRLLPALSAHKTPPVSPGFIP